MILTFSAKKTACFMQFFYFVQYDFENCFCG